MQRRRLPLLRALAQNTTRGRENMKRLLSPHPFIIQSCKYHAVSRYGKIYADGRQASTSPSDASYRYAASATD